MPSSNPQRKSIWINKPQLTSVTNESPFQAHMWGRGSGKTTLIGIKNYNRFKRLARALFFLSSSTYHQLLTKSLPPITDFWSLVGLKEYDWKEKSGHYVIGQKPPSHFEKPYKAPRKFDYCISFFNGFSIELLSMDRPDLARGGNFDGGDVDESALVPKDALMTVLIPSVRGGKDKFTDPLHGQISLYTSPPWLSIGQYIFEYEEKAKTDKDFFWSEATAKHNLKALGPNWLETQKKLLDPRIFRLEVLNERLIRSSSMFYHRFDDQKHTYKPLITYKAGIRGIETDRFMDHNINQLLDITFDFGGWFNCALVFQATTKAQLQFERCIDSFHVKEQGIEDLVDLICEHYKDSQALKYVRLWGEPRGIDRTPMRFKLFESIEMRFARHGWQTELMAKHSYADKHETRRVYVNELLEETTSGPRIRFNESTCKDPIIAIQMTGTTSDGKKDKSNERDRNFNQEHATHYTDALDYYLMQKHFSPDSGMGCEVW